MNEIINSAKAYLKKDLVEMWNLVLGQVEKSRLAIIENNKNIAHRVRVNEKRVDAFELKIDMDTESVIMLKNPVAYDMRFLVSVLKINYNLERIGDYANTIAIIAENIQNTWSEEIINKTHIPEMYYMVQTMLQESLDAFENEDKEQVMGLFQIDKKLDKFNRESKDAVIELMKKDINGGPDYLDAFSVVKRLERAGDHILNIGEELIFLFEAKVIRHSKLK